MFKNIYLMKSLCGITAFSILCLNLLQALTRGALTMDSITQVMLLFRDSTVLWGPRFTSLLQTPQTQ